MELPQRKPNRIPLYDYNRSGAYFITICTKDRKPVLSDIVGVDAHIDPKPWGKIAEKYLNHIPEIEKYVIMPDHIHMIIHLQEKPFDSRADVGIGPYKENEIVPPQKHRIASIVRSIKILITKEIGTSIFQRSYYDHIIRNQEDFNEIWNYIDNNPMKWKLSHMKDG